MLDTIGGLYEVIAYTVLSGGNTEAITSVFPRASDVKAAVHAAALDTIGGLYEVLAYQILTGRNLSAIAERLPSADVKADRAIQRPDHVQ